MLWHERKAKAQTLSRDSIQPQGSTLSPAERKRWTRIGVLSALALLLSYAETFVPIPLPGVKLGLANVPVLVTLARSDVAGALCVSAIKVLASGLLFGSPVTMAYAAVGTLLSLAGMIPLSRLRTMHLWMVSIVGALLHETGQLLVASMLLGTTAVWYLAPALLVAGCVTGALCGVLATGLTSALPEGDDVDASNLATIVPVRPPRHTTIALCALIAFSVAVLRLTSLEALGICVVIALICCAITRVSAQALLGTVRPLLALLVATLAIQLILSPHTALEESARCVGRLVAIAAASVACMQLVPTDDLAGTIAWFALPVSRMGVHTEGFVLATSVAVQLLPTLADVLHGYRSTQGSRLTLRSLRDILPNLVNDLYARL